MGLTQLDPSDAEKLSAAQRLAALDQRGTRVNGHAFHPSAADLARVNQVPSGDPALHTLGTAAALIHAPAAAVRTSMRQSVRAGAALLAHDERALVGTLPASPGQWYAAVARYSGAADVRGAMLFADRVYSVIRHGAARTTADGQRVVLQADPAVTPDRSSVSKLGLATDTAAASTTPSPECPSGLSCSFVPAAYCCSASNYGNYDLANRPADGDAIRYIVIHDTEGSYSGTISEFQDPASNVSAHYVVQSSTGDVTQMVQAKDIAWHAGNWYVNMHAIGIENEGYALKGATWYTPSEYQSSAALVKYLAARFSIPLDRQHIIGHDDVPGPTDSYAAGMHWDPGPYWDWNYFMKLAGAPIRQPDAGSLPVGSEITIDPPFSSANEPTVTGCTTSSGSITACPQQPANFVYLRTSPSSTAPLLADPYLHSSGSGTTRAWDWGDKAASGHTFVVAGEHGSWTAIWYAGRKAWFYNPNGQNAAPAARTVQMVVTPNGTSAIHVYGRAYPAQSAYPPTVTSPPNPSISPLSKYSIQPGQEYVPAAPGSPIDGDYADTNYSATQTVDETVVTDGGTQYYPVRFNHRLAYVMASDVKLVPATLPPAYTPVTPVRMLDTRNGTGGITGPVGPGATVSLQVAGQDGVPASGLTSVVLNVTAMSPTAKSYITVYADGRTRPGTPNLYFTAWHSTTNLVVVPVGSDGKVDFYNHYGSVNLLADLAGYYTTSGGSWLDTTSPVRILNTKNGTGGYSTPVGSGGTISLQVTGKNGVPSSGVTAVVLNVTAVNPTAKSYVTVYPDAQPRPNTLNLFFYRGDKFPNLVVVPVGSDGKVDFYNHYGSVNLLADLAGYYTSGGSWLHTSGPVRLLDTRNGTGGYSTPVGAGKTITVKVTGKDGIPSSGVTAVVLNVTAVNPTQAGYVTVYPYGRTRPGTPNLDFRAGETFPNLVIVPVGSGGKVSFYNAYGSVNLLADLAGYYMK
jgi:N-acetylmuramoyl-L-alanine amidase-like protein